MQEQIQPIEEEKKSRLGIWIILIVVLIVIGILLYFWLSKGSVASPVTPEGIPSPPALP